MYGIPNMKLDKEKIVLRRIRQMEAEGVKFTLVNAFHSSGADDGAYTGEAAGIVIELEDGRKVYFAGDTCVFGDMQLIGRIYSPDVAVL